MTGASAILPARGPEITFINTAFDFGVLTQGEPAVGTYRFVNTGDETLVLHSVKTSCGCLVPIWDRTPIAPGDTGMVQAKYDSRRIGIFKKSVTVHSNAVNYTNGVARLDMGGVVVTENTNVVWHAVRADRGKIDVVHGEKADTLYWRFGTVPFGELRHAVFGFSVRGAYPLSIRDGQNLRDQPDPVKLMSDMVAEPFGLDENRRYFVKEGETTWDIPNLKASEFKQRFDSGDSGYLKVLLTSNIGNVGAFRQVFTVHANVGRRALLVLEGNFTMPEKDVVLTESRSNGAVDYQFEGGKLVRVKHFNGGRLQREREVDGWRE
ncbi:MAG: DUF1573 domain-containing protein [Bacteroidota bacterium]